MKETFVWKRNCCTLYKKFVESWAEQKERELLAAWGDSSKDGFVCLFVDGEEGQRECAAKSPRLAGEVFTTTHCVLLTRLTGD